MSIGNINTPGNLRAAYGMLAKAGLGRLEPLHPAKPPGNIDVYSLNLIRMLEMYRYGTFYSHLRTGTLEDAPLGTDPFSQGRDEVSESRFVFQAIKRAHAAVSDMPRVEFVQSMEAVFTSAFHENLEPEDAPRIALAKAFLRRLVANLDEATSLA